MSYDDDDDRPRRRKKGSSNTMIIVIVIIIILLLLIGGGYYYYTNYYDNCGKTKCTNEIFEKNNITGFKLNDKGSIRYYASDKCICECDDFKTCFSGDTLLKADRSIDRGIMMNKNLPCKTYNKYSNTPYYILSKDGAQASTKDDPTKGCSFD